MPCVLNARLILSFALFTAAVEAVVDNACPVGSSKSDCIRADRSLAIDSILLQRTVGHGQHHQEHHVAVRGPNMVNDEDGFVGGNEIGEIVDAGCAEGNVRRRRRAETMCSCRRRSSDKLYDGGWACQNDKMVQQMPTYTKPVWSEEFDDERGDGSLNESRWTLTYSGSGNGNNEKQFYTKRQDNLHIDNGVLKIIGKRETFEGKKYTSGKITTRGIGFWGPGTRIEVRAKLPLGVGTWPAIWMMPENSNYGNWPKSGEIDIMEAIGRSHGKVFGTIHTHAYNHMKGTQKGKSFYTDFSEWHTYALHWEEDKLTWYTDGNLYNTFKPHNSNNYAEWPFKHPFYLILNLALGGNLGGSIRFSDDQVMEVDYVRVFCLDGSINCKAEKISCCSKCPGRKHCSPKSGNCYDDKMNSYYETCEVPEQTVPSPTPRPDAVESATCCGACAGKGFCSPKSKQCYNSKKRDYYLSCSDGSDGSGLSQETKNSCCSKCNGRNYCSPKSGNCYQEKRQAYYETCREPVLDQGSTEGACCGNCFGSYPFCSPNSGSCYFSKSKDYYRGCTTTTTTPCVGGECNVITVMSYNTQYNNYNSRMGGYAAKIKNVAPAVVGLQECQNRDGLASLSGYMALRGTGRQNFILHDPRKLTLVSEGNMRIPRDNYAERAITWGQFKLANSTIWFFNTHLPHNHNEAWSKKTHAKIARKFLEERKKLGAANAPTIVVGDMNSFASDYNKVEGGGFESNLQANGFTWAYTAKGNPGHGGLDHILYSREHWTTKKCRDNGTGGSDHPAITCELVLK